MTRWTPLARCSPLQGRATVPDVIIFETDGQANQPSTLQPCNYFNTKATPRRPPADDLHDRVRPGQPARAVHFDTSGSRSRQVRHHEPGGGRDAASPDDVPGGCGLNENKDGDHYFCTPGSTDLEPVFRQVAAAAIETAHLID